MINKIKRQLNKERKRRKIDKMRTTRKRTINKRKRKNEKKIKGLSSQFSEIIRKRHFYNRNHVCLTESSTLRITGKEIANTASSQYRGVTERVEIMMDQLLRDAKPTLTCKFAHHTHLSTRHIHPSRSTPVLSLRRPHLHCHSCITSSTAFLQNTKLSLVLSVSMHRQALAGLIQG